MKLKQETTKLQAMQIANNDLSINLSRLREEKEQVGTENQALSRTIDRLREEIADISKNIQTDVNSNGDLKLQLEALSASMKSVLFYRFGYPNCVRC
jgi:chromosome segregation ATPase